MGKFTVWAATFAVLTGVYTLVSNVGTGERPETIGMVTIVLAIIAILFAAMSVFQNRNDV